MEILVQPLNRSIRVEPGVNLLQALQAAQVPMSYSCMAGRCGTCRCRVAAPRPTAGTLRDVFEYLSARTLLGSELYVLSPQFQPISIAVSLEVVDSATEQQVFRAVEQTLLAYLWPLPPHGLRGKGWPRGRSIEINELRTQAGRVDGVEAVNALRLFHQDLTTLAWLELSDRQALPLTDYQLPELMAVALQSGEGQPVPPRAFAPGGITLPGSAGSPGNSTTGRRAAPPRHRHWP